MAVIRSHLTKGLVVSDRPFSLPCRLGEGARDEPCRWVSMPAGRPSVVLRSDRGAKRAAFWDRKSPLQGHQNSRRGQCGTG